MLEVVKLILEMIAKSLSLESLRAAKRTKKLTEIGTELFVLYSSLNAIIVIARDIVTQLENARRWTTEKLNGGEPDREYYTSLPFLLRQQQVQLIQFVRSVKRLHHELELVAAAEYHSLYPLIKGKFNAVTLLLRSIEGENGGERLVSVQAEELRSLTEHALLFDRQNAMAFLVVEPIQPLASIPARNRDLIAHYLDTRRPSEAIEQLSKVADDLRSKILATFSASDILLSIGDRRAASTDHWIGFE